MQFQKEMVSGSVIVLWYVLHAKQMAVEQMIKLRFLCGATTSQLKKPCCLFKTVSQ